ncbi:hypothetical protein [Anaerococcus ihuae]|uniref:hypothetical protein n=1 Tax=Anaerococcus ihuae TaxID=2899519 RepID=UPI001F1C529C|nr:hypothetical protein [Anaerococcus ihuae]
MENSNYSNKLKIIAKDLGEYIKVIDDKKSLLKFVLSKAKEKRLTILLINDCYYIKNENPKSVLHLNISDKINSSSFINVKEEEDFSFETNLNTTEISGILNICMLLEEGLGSFDILLTNTYISDYNRDFSILRSVIRSKNIINLNLNESDCIAEGFASHTISTAEIPINRVEINEDIFLQENSIYRISLENIVGNNYSDDLNNNIKNAIKMLITFIRKIKSKVDIDIVNIEGGGKNDRMPSYCFVDLVCKNEFVNDLLNVFDLFVSEYLSTNFKFEPNLKFDIKKIDYLKFYPMTQESYEHISSFVELSLNGTYSVDSNTKTTIASSILTRVRTSSYKFNSVMIFRSLSEDSLLQMLDKTKLASNINGGEFKNRLSIPSWQNENDSLAIVFKKSYDQLFKTNLKIIKTQYSLDCNVIFYKFDVNMISIGVKYKQVDVKTSASDFKDILKTFYLLKDVLFKLDKNMEK